MPCLAALRRRGRLDPLLAWIPVFATFAQGAVPARADACARTRGRLPLPAVAGVAARGGRDRAGCGTTRTKRAARVDRLVARRLLRDLGGGTPGLSRRAAQSRDPAV